MADHAGRPDPLDALAKELQLREPLPRIGAAPSQTADRTQVDPARLQPATSIVLPVYNEESRLHRSFEELRQRAANQRWGDDVEVIVVDDGSTDRTVEVARGELDQLACARLVRLPWHAGKGAAVRLGMTAAHGDAIVFMDADLATDLNALPEGLKALRFADVVIGSRVAPGSKVTGRSRLRRLLHRTFGSQARRLTSVPASDPQCGFKAFRREAAEVLFSMSHVNGFGFDVEILVLARKVGYRIVELPVQWHAVEGSHVHVVRDPVTMLRDVMRVRLRYVGKLSGAETSPTDDPPLTDAPVAPHDPGASAAATPIPPADE